MRRGYKCVPVKRGARFRKDVDRTTGEFAESMGYGARRYPSREAFLQSFNEDWILDMRASLRDLLQKERRVLSIGSGECEHEIPFFLEGYSIVGSDIVPAAFAHTKELFPEFSAMPFDLFHPDTSLRFDDLLITGMDFYYPDEQAKEIFFASRRLLSQGGRLVFTLRYHDNTATWLIDFAAIPALCIALNVYGCLCRSDRRYRLKLHGYRRSRAEIVAMARQAGFRLGRVRYAGFGVEATRLMIDRFFPRSYAWLRKQDHRWLLFNNATIFEFLA